MDDILERAILSNPILYSEIILEANNFPSTDAQLRFMDEAPVGIHVLQCARNSGCTTMMIKHLMHRLESSYNTTLIVAFSTLAELNDFVYKMKCDILTYRDKTHFNISAKRIVCNKTNTLVMFHLGKKEHFRGLNYQDVYLSNMNFWSNDMLEDFLTCVKIPTYTSGLGRVFICNSGYPAIIPQQYEIELGNNVHTFQKFIYDDLSLQMQSRLINTYGIDTYERNYLCI